jgi:hypothetical protein
MSYDNCDNGTWTPTLVGSTVAGTTSYTTQQGYYTKIGSLVFITGTIVITAASGTGSATIGALPFTIRNQTNGSVMGNILLAPAVGTWPYVTGTTYLTLLGLINTTTCGIYCSGTAVTGAQLAMANAALTVEFSLTYQI